MDASGNGHVGAIAGATWTAAGRFGGALAFDGVNDWVTIADAAALDLTTGMTLEAWVYPTALSGWRTAVLKESADGLAYALYAHNDAPRPATTINTGGPDLEALGTSALPLNAWTHLASTYDGATLRMYVDGCLVGSLATGGSIVTTADALRIGGNEVWGEFFQGRIDEIRVYDRALSQTEIEQDMGRPVVRIGEATGPVAAYGFEDGSGLHAADASGNGHVGAISGATWTTSGRFGGALAFDGVNDWVTVRRHRTVGSVNGHDVGGVGLPNRAERLAHGGAEGNR